MFNNAGISGTTYDRFLDDPLNDFQRMSGVNLLGVMLGTQRAARHMAAHGGGSIINNSSMAALKAGFGVMTYRAVKAAVVHFTKSVAIDLAEYAVRVNCIAPGHIRTEMTAYSTPGMTPDVARPGEGGGGLRSRIRAGPLKRTGTPRRTWHRLRSISAATARAQVTGIVLPVDGGASAGDSVNHLQEHPGRGGTRAANKDETHPFHGWPERDTPERR